MKKLSEKFKSYIRKIVFRAMVFLTILAIYIFDKSLLNFTSNWNNNHIFAPTHILWVILFLEILIKLNPKSNISFGCLKQFRRYYKRTNEKYDTSEQKEECRNKDKGALLVMISWISLNLIVGILYYRRFIGVEELVLICAAYYLSDLICVMFFCPFQKFLMKNKCCVTCRIFAWGEAMFTTPLVFIKNFYSLSLFGFAMCVFIKWENTYRKYPERFLEMTNVNLRCSNCTDKLCKVKL